MTSPLPQDFLGCGPRRLQQPATVVPSYEGEDGMRTRIMTVGGTKRSVGGWPMARRAGEKHDSTTPPEPGRPWSPRAHCPGARPAPPETADASTDREAILRRRSHCRPRRSRSRGSTVRACRPDRHRGEPHLNGEEWRLPVDHSRHAGPLMRLPAAVRIGLVVVLMTPNGMSVTCTFDLCKTDPRVRGMAN